MARPQRNTSLHGLAPHTAETAVLVIDVFSDFRFPEGAELAAETAGIVRPLKTLLGRARKHGVPVIYINDNTGLWQSDGVRVLERALRKSSRGRSIATALKPGRRDYLVLKPKQSAFYGTPLETLLDHMKTKRLILTGIAADICVLFTAQDAFVRDYEVWVGEDAVASRSGALMREALALMERQFQTRVARCAEIPLP